MPAQSDAFIWTEVFNCGELASVVVPSYLAHHSHSIHVFGFEDDLRHVPTDDRVTKVRLPAPGRARPAVRWPLSSKIDERFVRKGYRSGHLGTARLWASLMLRRPERYLIHFDSDLIFLGPAVEIVLGTLSDGYSLAGTRRAYKFNLNNREDVRHRPDCVDTLCFGFDRTRLRWHTYPGLVRMVRGQTLLQYAKGNRVIDFFDTVSFELMAEGRVAYLDSMSEGPHGQRALDSPFMDNFIELWSSAGSGCAFRKAGRVDVPDIYVQHALRSYALYAHYLLGEPFDGALPDSGTVEAKLARLDRATWTLT